MSNRQARREQSRTQRAQRAAGTGRGRRSSGGGRGPGGGSWLTQPFTLIAAGFGIVLAIALGVVLVISGGGESDEAVAALEEAKAALPLELVDGNKLGRDDAPVKLTQYEDFQCGHCLRYTADQEPVLVEEYVKTGKLQIIHEHFAALGLESGWSANAAMCAADQNLFWQYQNLLFLTQAESDQLDSPSNNSGKFDIEVLKEFGTEVGIPDQARFDECVDGGEHEEDIADQIRTARSFGLTGTPGFLVNGRPLGGGGAPSTLDEWRSILDTAIEEIENPPADETATPEATATTAAEATATPEPAPTDTPETVPTDTPEPAPTATPEP